MQDFNYKNKNLSTEVVDKYKIAAKEYASQGFDEDMIAELLEIDGCPRETAKQIPSIVLNDLPADYIEGPPTSYVDVRSKVEKSIKTASLENIKLALKTGGVKNLNELEKMIVSYRDTGNSMLLNEIHKELEPIVENSILNNRIAKSEQNIKTSEAEDMQMKLFGVWPAELLNKYEQKNRGEIRLCDLTKKKMIEDM